MKKSKIFITGVSSGIGRGLVKKLIKEGHNVAGVARREDLLRSLKKELEDNPLFFYKVADVGKESDWNEIINWLKREKFMPEIVIFNAAILENDLIDGLNFDLTKKMININFLGVMYGISLFLKITKNAQYLAISSSSALKGSGLEGVGYAASKAALSIGFESLYQKYKGSNLVFKTLFFGPVRTGMSPFTKNPPLSLTEDQAVEAVVISLSSSRALHFYPFVFFFFLKFMKLLPQSLYFKILSIHESFRSNFRSSR